MNLYRKLKRNPNKKISDFQNKTRIRGTRFEMPFHARCKNCKIMIAKGERFSARKKKVGKDYKSDVYEFSFKCRCCKEFIVMKSNPSIIDYEFVEGAYKIVF